jgi:hypothetical protein
MTVSETVSNNAGHGIFWLIVKNYLIGFLSGRWIIRRCVRESHFQLLETNQCVCQRILLSKQLPRQFNFRVS